MNYNFSQKLREENRTFLNFVSIALIFLSGAYLILVNSHLGLGDDGIYILAGERIINGEAIYTDGFRGGPTGALYLYGLSRIIPGFWIVLQIANIAGLYYVLRKYTPGLELMTRNLLYLFVIWSGPAREMLYDHQLSGFLVAIFIQVLSKTSTGTNTRLGFFNLMIFAFACEIKPHLAIPFLIALLSLRAGRVVLLKSFLFLLTTHFAIWIYVGRITDIEWFKILIGLSRDDSNSGWSEVSNIWPILEMLFRNHTLWVILSYTILLVLSLKIFSASRVGNTNLTLVLCAIYLFFLPYNHLYDFTLLGILFAISLVHSKISIIASAILGLWLIPVNILEPTNAGLALAGMLCYTSLKSVRLSQFVASYFLSIFVLVLAHTFFYIIFPLVSVDQSITVSALVLFAFFRVFAKRTESLARE